MRIFCFAATAGKTFKKIKIQVHARDLEIQYFLGRLPSSLLNDEFVDSAILEYHLGPSLCQAFAQSNFVGGLRSLNRRVTGSRPLDQGRLCVIERTGAVFVVTLGV